MNTVLKIREQQKALDTKLASIQKACSHPEDARTKTYSGDSGYWDKNDDWTATTHHCGLCDKRWTITKDGYGTTSTE